MLTNEEDLILEDNEIVGYEDKMAIVKSESDVLYFVEMPEEFCTPGEVVFTKDLTPITELPEEMQIKLKSIYLSD